LFSYYVFGKWWNSSAGTLLIIFFSFLIWKKDFLQIIGLKMDVQTIVKSIILGIIIAVCSFLFMKYIAARHNVTIYFADWRNIYHDIFYVLNEEIILGAITLFILVHKKNVKPVVASIGLAVAFSLIHYVFYRWIFNDNGIIQISTLITLFLIGYVRNNLILSKGHIGYSWALHFGWIVIMLGCYHFNTYTLIKVNDYIKFNYYLGSVEMLFISIVLAGLSLLHWIKKVHPKTFEPVESNSC